MRKACVRCGTEKDQRAFDRDSTREDGRYPWCKLCRKKYSPKAQQSLDGALNGRTCPLCDTPIRGHANRKYCSNYCRDRVQGLSKRFGLTVEQYRKLIPEDGLCPICRKRPRKWVVEHNHSTGLITGLVDTGCNVGMIAYSGHDPEVARRLYEYLREPPAERVIGQHQVPDDPEGKLRGKSKIHAKWGRRG